MRATNPGYLSRTSRVATVVALVTIMLTAVSAGESAASLAQSALTSTAQQLCFIGGSLPDVPVGPFSGDMVAADLDGDTDIDLAVLGTHDENVQIRLNNGDGTFTSAADVPTGQLPSAIAAGDLDGDYDTDLAVVNNLDDNVSIFLNNGNGTFASAAAVSLPVGDGPVSIAIGDLDGDGDLDFATPADNELSIRFNNGDATFTSGTDMPGFIGGFRVAIANLDGDGDSDLAVLDNYNREVEILLNDGTGTFSPTASVSLPTGALGPESFALDDLDGDSDIDIAVTLDNGVAIRLNNGNAAFGSAPFVPVDVSLPTSIVAGDLDGDDDADLAMLNGSLLDPAVIIRLNNGTGTFAAGSDLPMGDLPRSLVVEDLNGDSLNDLAVVNLHDNDVSIRLNYGNGDFVGFADVPVHTPGAMVVEDFVASTYPDLALLAQAEYPLTGPVLVIRPNNGEKTFDLTRPDIPLGGSGDSMTAADLDGDSDLDLAVANSLNTYVSVLLNNGNGTFTASSVSVGQYPGDVVAADLDGDSDVDLAVAKGLLHDAIAIRLNNGNGTFAYAPDVAAPYNQGELAVADIDGDSDADLVVGRTTGEPTDYISVKLNNGNATFVPGPEVPVLKYTEQIVPADLDGDTDVDLAVESVVGGSTGAVEIVLNDGNGNLSVGSSITFDDNPRGIGVGDLDGDTDLDLAVGRSTTVAILLNNGDATFDDTHPEVPAGSSVGSVALADLDGDNDLDLAAVAQLDDSVAIRLNTGFCGGGNEAPAAFDDGPYSTAEDTPLAVPAPGVLGNDTDPDGDPLAAVPDSAPANGSLVLNADGSFSYSPSADWCGADGFTYRANDGEADSNAATASIVVACVNDPPVANDDSVTTPEDDAVTVDVLANDFDVDGNLDPASAAVTQAPSSGLLSSGGSGIFTYTPEADWNGSDSFTYQVCDIDGLCDTATVTIGVTPVNDPPVMGSLANQKVQYSDGIVPIAVSATDIDSMPLTFAASGLPAGLSLTAPACEPVGQGSSCTATIEGSVRDLAGTYEATITVSDGNGLGDAEIVTITVEPENATIRFPVPPEENEVAWRVDGSDNDVDSISLVVLVEETYPDTVYAGQTPYPGDLTNVSLDVKLVPVGPGGPLSGSCTYSVESGGYAGLLTATCGFADVPVNTYIVSVKAVGGYYTGFSEDVLVVYDPSLGFTTGGGWFYWPGTQDKTNFGYTMKYNKKGQKVQGSFLLIRHLDDGTKYRVKSNALYGLALGGDSEMGWASFSGKATYLEPGWVEPIGNHEFVVYVEDLGEPGTGVDRIWLEMHDRDGDVIPVLSMARRAVDNAETIGGGNIVVPH